MRILLIGFLGLLAGCAVEASNTQTTTPQETTAPQGYSISQEYTGSYTCPQGPTNVDLEVLSNPNNPAVQYAIFAFGPPGTDPKSNPQGSYLMSGTFDLGSGNLAFRPVSWIKEPLFFTMVGMSGNSGDGGATFSGTINSLGCGNFQISNVAGSPSPASSQTATQNGSAVTTPAPSEAPLQSTPPNEIHSPILKEYGQTVVALRLGIDDTGGLTLDQFVNCLQNYGKVSLSGQGNEFMISVTTNSGTTDFNMSVVYPQALISSVSGGSVDDDSNFSDIVVLLQTILQSCK